MSTENIALLSAAIAGVIGTALNYTSIHIGATADDGMLFRLKFAIGQWLFWQVLIVIAYLISHFIG